MNKTLSLVDRMSRLSETLAVALIFGYCALILAEVVARAQARSFSFSWEFSRYAMAATFALAAGPAIRTGFHVRISLLSDSLPPKLARWLDMAANIAALVIVALMVQAMWVKSGKSFDRNILATTVSKTPLWLPQAMVLYGLVQFWLDLLARLVRRWFNRTHEWQTADAEPGDA